jgi:hypothetical protein
MKKLLLFVSLFLMAAAVSFGQQAATFNWIDDAPVIDGDPSDAVWSNAAVTTLTPANPFKTETPSLTEPTVKAFWNDTALFVYCSTNDDAWFPTWMTTVQEYESDKFELYLDVNADIVDGKGAKDGVGNGNYQYAPQFQETTMGDLIVWTDGTGNGMTASDNYDGAGFSSMEYSIAWEDVLTSEGVAFDPFGQSTMGFDVTFIDCDAAAGPRNRLVWSNDGTVGGLDESWATMDGVGVITLSTGSAVQLKDVETLNVYPTVVSDYINIPSEVNSVEIFNSIGQRVMSIENPGTQVSVARLQTGIHFVKVKKDSNERVTKIIVK